MKTKCLNVIEELQQTNSKVNDQEEKIKNLQTKLLEAKEEIDQLLCDRKIEIKVQQSHYNFIFNFSIYQLRVLKG